MSAAHRGIDLSDHTPHRFTNTDVENADAIFAMEYGQMQRLQRMFPHKRDKIHLLRCYAPFPYSLFVNIDDPFGWGMDQFAACFDLVDKSLNGLFKSNEPKYKQK